MSLKSQSIDGGTAMRAVDSLTVHGSPLSFRELCKRTISHNTDYLVLDVDHTTHLHRNLGELLGWEICAEAIYGRTLLDEINEERAPGRLLLLKNKPLATLRYLIRATRDWALPGLFYLVWAKWLTQLKSTRPLAYLKFGLDPREDIQGVPQHTLLAQLADLPLSTLRHMANRVWKRHQQDEIINQEDLAWLRKRCPGLTIILSSASPQPVLESAARHLDVDHIFYTRVEEHGGFLSHPSSHHARRGRKIPRRISPLEKLQVNARENKVKALEQQFPDIFKPCTQSVGITDTGYGEDHCWADHFDVVVDINSTDPFPPIVAATSPCSQIHSAEVLSRKEITEQLNGNTTFRDPRRKTHASPKDQRFLRHELEEILGPHLRHINRLARAFKQRKDALDPTLASARSNCQEAQRQLNRIVNEFNCAAEPEKKQIFNAFHRHLRAVGRMSSKMTKHLRPLALLNCQIKNILEEARLELSCAHESA